MEWPENPWRLQLIYVTLLIFLVDELDARTKVNMDKSLSKAICKQHEIFKWAQEIQEPLTDQQKHPQSSGCEWVTWDKCEEGACDQFKHTECSDKKQYGSQPEQSENTGKVEEPTDGKEANTLDFDTVTQKLDFKTFSAFVGPNGLITKPLQGRHARQAALVPTPTNEDATLQKSTCYAISVETATYQHAAEICRMGYGELVSIESKAEDEWLGKWVKEHNQMDLYYWTSGTEEFQEGSPIWQATCQPFVYTNFGTPNLNDENKNNLAVLYDGSPQGSQSGDLEKGMFWLNGNNSFRFICERQVSRCRLLFGAAPARRKRNTDGSIPVSLTLSEREKNRIQSVRTKPATTFTNPLFLPNPSEPFEGNENVPRSKRQAPWTGGRITPERNFDPRCYSFSSQTQKYNWTEGRDICAGAEQGDLVDMETQREFQYVGLLLQRYRARSKPQVEIWWTAGNDMRTEGFVQWATTCGSVETVKHPSEMWNPWIKKNEYNYGNTATTNCLAYEWTVAAATRGWNMAPCSMKYRIVCKSRRAYCRHPRYVDGLTFPWVNFPKFEFHRMALQAHNTSMSNVFEDSQRNFNGDSQPNTNTNTDSKPITNTSPQPNTHTDSKPSTNTSPQPSTNTDSKPSTNTDSGAGKIIPSGSGRNDNKTPRSQIHVRDSLSKAVCAQLKSFQQTKQLQQPLKKKALFVTGEDICSYYQRKRCDSPGSCEAFKKKGCDQVKVR